MRVALKYQYNVGTTKTYRMIHFIKCFNYWKTIIYDMNHTFSYHYRFDT